MINHAQTTIEHTLTSWSGVEAKAHRFGGREFTLGKREIGHIHGNRMVAIPFPVKIRKQLVAAGEAEPHHILPESGWVSFYIREAGNVDKALALLERSYNLALAQKARREEREEARRSV